MNFHDNADALRGEFALKIFKAGKLVDVYEDHKESISVYGIETIHSSSQ